MHKKIDLIIVFHKLLTLTACKNTHNNLKMELSYLQETEALHINLTNQIHYMNKKKHKINQFCTCSLMN